MANHLMSRHTSPTAFTLRARGVQSVEHFFAVSYIEESFHFGKGVLQIQNGARRRCFISRPRPKSRLVASPEVRILLIGTWTIIRA